jgi:hypothetical protein
MDLDESQIREPTNEMYNVGASINGLYIFKYKCRKGGTWRVTDVLQVCCWQLIRGK